MVAGTGMVSSEWVPTMVLGSSAMTTPAKGRGHNKTTIQTTTIKHPLGIMATNEVVGLVIEEGIIPGSMKLGLVVNTTQNAQSCQILRSAWRRRLNL